MIADSDHVVKSITLSLTAIAFLTEDELEIFGSKDGADSVLSDDGECEWIAPERRGASGLFEDELV